MVKDFLKTFYSHLWTNPLTRKKIKLDILQGNHNEKAFIEVKSNAECTKDDLAPLFKPLTKKNSVFYNHIDAVQIRRA